MEQKILPRSFYERDTPEVAKDLLGKLLVHIRKGVTLIGIISETEAYRSDDAASHAFRGKTRANRYLFGEVGHAYLYWSYGIHTCLNTVAYDSRNYHAGGVLIRAFIPLQGIEVMQILRHHRANIAKGPGNVTEALDVTMQLEGVDLTTPKAGLYVTTGYTIEPQMIATSPRIGISKNTDIHWRYYLTKQAIENLLKGNK